jgi:hypothetical protein
LIPEANELHRQWFKQSAMVVTRFFDNPNAENRRPLDWSAFLLTGAALFCILCGIARMAAAGANSRR